MSRLTFAEAVANAAAAKKVRGFPDKASTRHKEGILYPEFTPKFQLSFTDAATVFTIGSCFARNVEEALAPRGVRLPTRRFAVPKSEWPARPNGLLNEYNPGSIATRVLNALDDVDDPLDTIVDTNAGSADLLLLGGPDVDRQRAIRRREDIRDVYRQVAASDVVIITLGLIEAWYDNVSERYLNRMPPWPVATAQPDRYTFHRMDVFSALPLLEKAVVALGAAGKKIILTVSPVPLQTTFSGEDCVVANDFSKAVLRVCAQRLFDAHPHVDYFPSYEIVRSAGLSAYIDDNVHVKDSVVKDIIDYMVGCYSR